jgi:Na+-driven multidrug efflux pump
LNRSIFTGIIAAVLFSSIASHLMRNLKYHLNTSFTIAISYIIYYTVFGVLYYHDNKEEYLLENRKLDTKKLIRNILKIVFSVGIAEIFYVIIRWSLHFYILTIGYEPYLTSIIAHIASAIVFAIMINLGVKVTKLFNNRYDYRYSKI